MACSPDGRTIAAASLWVRDSGQVWPSRLVLWDIPGNRQGADLGMFGEDTLDSLAFSPDSRLLAAGFASGTIRFWEMTTPTPSRSLEGHRGKVQALAFTPDGKTLLSGGGDGAVRGWDVSTGHPRSAFDWDIGNVRTIALAPNSFARVALVTTSAAAPSFTPGAFPAVTVPSFLNAGLSERSTSMVVSSRGDSSLSKITGAAPFFLAGSSTGTICDLKRHSLIADTALR